MALSITEIDSGPINFEVIKAGINKFRESLDIHMTLSSSFDVPHMCCRTTTYKQIIEFGKIANKLEGLIYCSEETTENIMAFDSILMELFERFNKLT